MLRRMLLLLAPLLAAAEASAIVAQPFTATGTYLRSGPAAFTIGAGGAVEEIEGFVLRAGDAAATRLSASPLPAGLALSFSSALSPDGSDLRLRYEVANTGAGPLAGLTFVSFLDAEIDEALNTFFQEYGETDGTPAAGQGWEIDEPGFAFGDIFANAGQGALDGTNAVPIGAPEDVSLALSFALGPLAPGEIARFDVLISEDGDALGGFALRQRDVDPRSTTAITFSGAASIVPEPGTSVLLGLGLGALAARRRGGR